MPEAKRGMPRSIIYFLIPAGFILLVVLMVFGGFFRAEEERAEPDTVVPLETPAETVRQLDRPEDVEGEVDAPNGTDPGTANDINNPGINVGGED